MFYANIVNELRTPLSVILDKIDCALVEANEEARSASLRSAQRNVRRLERLAGQMSDLVRLDEGRFKRHARKLDIVPFVESLVTSFDDLADRNGLLLEFLARRSAVRGYVDPQALTTVVSNLMSNAIKYTPSGGRIGAALDFRSPDRMHLSIVDSGVGIAQDRQADLFSISTHSLDEHSGAGVGLALAHRLITLYEGEIQVQSSPDKGSRFDVILPIGVEVDESDVALEPPQFSRPEVTAEILYRSTIHKPPDAVGPSPATVLLVDSNDEYRRWVTETLIDLATVESTDSTNLAISMARETVPDLVIADDRSPACDGVELTRGLRGDSLTSHIPVVLISANTRTDRRIDAFDAGVDDYLAKPIESRELLAKAASILDRHRELRQRFREQVVIHPAEICEQSVDQKFLEKVTAIIESSIESSDFSVQDLGDAVAMSTSQLTRKLRALIDQSPARLIRRMRLQRAADLLAGNAGQVAEICFKVGFCDQSHFSRSFKREFGVPPAAYRRQKESRNNE